jgi:hypothetical protein
VDECVRRAERFVEAMSSRNPAGRMDYLATDESLIIAGRIEEFVKWRSGERVIVSPVFPGCGWVDDAQADLLIDSTLIEIKAGERHFRAIDIRQILSYCALNSSSQSYRIDSVMLLNPRVGTLYEEGIEDLCQKTAGSPSPAILGAIIEYISEPQLRYASEQ